MGLNLFLVDKGKEALLLLQLFHPFLLLPVVVVLNDLVIDTIDFAVQIFPAIFITLPITFLKILHFTQKFNLFLLL